MSWCVDAPATGHDSWLAPVDARAGGVGPGGAEFADLDATIVGISGKDLASKESFSAKYGLTIPLLADPDRSVAALYGAKAPIIGTKRTTFVIDGEGVIRFRHDATLGLTFLSTADLKAAIVAANSTSAD